MHFVKQASLLGCALSMAFVVGLMGVLPAQAVTPRRDLPERTASSTRSLAQRRERFSLAQGSHLYGKVVETFPDHVTLETSSGAFFGAGNKKTNHATSRFSSGLIPVTRNLQNERRLMPTALVAFKKTFGRAPNFRSERENTAWNTLMYRIRFPRDLVKEQKGIVSYRSLMRRTPVSPFDWAFVRLLGYVR